MTLNAYEEVSIPFTIKQDSCFVFEYLIESRSVFEIEVLSLLPDAFTKQIIDIKADSKDLLEVYNIFHWLFLSLSFEPSSHNAAYFTSKYHASTYRSSNPL